LSDALTTVSAQADLLLERASARVDVDSLQVVRQAADDAARLLHTLSALPQAPPTIHYSTGEIALDLRDVLPTGEDA